MSAGGKLAALVPPSERGEADAQELRGLGDRDQVGGPRVSSSRHPFRLTKIDQRAKEGVGSFVAMTLLSDSALDSILAMQVTIAWAGEGRCSPRRLGWWDTDLIDEAGGGDFFMRLLPQTHAWASLEAVREAARRTDAKVRAKMADPDKMRTLYFLGFETDEQLGDRLAAHKRSGSAPAKALPLPVPLTAEFSKEKLISALQGGDAAFTTVPNGRQLKGQRPGAVDVLVKRLAAALVPLVEQYPLPFYKLEG